MNLYFWHVMEESTNTSLIGTKKIEHVSKIYHNYIVSVVTKFSKLSTTNSKLLMETFQGDINFALLYGLKRR